MDERYAELAKVPQNALKPIEGGNLKGKTEINPQWRIEALTEKFGLCGIGWRFQVVDTQTMPLTDGQILLFMRINLFVKDNGKWSEPIPGFGGDYIVEKNKRGLCPNDEAYKMCLTDALSNAAKCIGVAADVYRGLYDTKYNRYKPKEQEAQTQPAAQQQAAAQYPVEDTWVKKVNGHTQVRGNNGWQYLSSMTAEGLQFVLSKDRYKAAWEEAHKLLYTGAA